MIGVTTKTATRSGPASSPVPATGRYFIVGKFDRGLIGAPVRVRSMADVERAYGGRVTFGSGYDDLKTYFEEGGAEAHVIRVVGPAATVGTKTFNDKASTPVPTLKVDAISPGAWSAGVTVEVKAGTVAGTYSLTVRGPVGDAEVFDNLANSADAATALTASAWVRGTDLGAATAAPNNIIAPAAAAALTAGNDDRAAITAARATDALALFGVELGTGAVALPGFPASQVGAAAAAHAATHGRLYLGAEGPGATAAAVKAAAAALTANGDHAGLFYPWIRVPLGGGKTKLVSPEGYVAACRARGHASEGPWRAPAGEIAEARYVVDVETPISQAAGDDLNSAGVSAIRVIKGGVRLYGWRSLSADVENFRLLTGRDVLNCLRYAGEDALESLVFRTIDSGGQLLGLLKTKLIGVVEPYRAAGGLYALTDEDGDAVDSGYSVDVGPAVNPPALLAQNRLAAVVAVRVSPTGEQIEQTIVKAALTANV